MIVTLICIGLLLLGIAATVIMSIIDMDLWEAGMFLSFIALLLLVVCIACACTNNSVSTYKEKMEDYNERLEELNSIKAAILKIEDNDTKLTAAIEYNKMAKEFKDEIKLGQKKANDPWINWLVPKVYNDMDIDAVEYIEYE